MQRIVASLAVIGCTLCVAADAQAFPITYTVTGKYSLVSGVDSMSLNGRTVTLKYVFESTDSFTQGTTTGGFTGFFNPTKVTMTLVGTRADGTYVAATPRTVVVVDYKPAGSDDLISLGTQTFGPSIGPARESILVTTTLEFNNSFMPGSVVNGLPLFDFSDVLSITSQVRTATSSITATYQFIGGGAFSDPEPQIQNVVPEPSALALLASGILGLACIGWRRRKRSPI